ncbi:putative acyltransferase [Deinococcus grandis]|uniref:Putative acyltransferase n=1 Tax=Deinococcus grandis TaxID=57498 RepID=A0A117DPA1_9DEIO|nr:GNAT family N-acetyltransferase [Deinococcus grandis]BBN93373.1 N-acetyltransferase [Deinococcus grandis]GAQ23116.1 putative acyltransferase [Deinococcus grandis]
MTTQTVRIVKASPADPRVLALMDAQQAELRELYVDTTEVTEAFDPQSLSGAGCVLLAAAREDGTLVGCGALKRWDAASAEVKRMYVTPDARGSGAARALLDALVARGRAHGYARLVLETGDRQHAAIALYVRAGFRRVPNFGVYVGVEDSLCFELPLA